jgi:hypothetical protein
MLIEYLRALEAAFDNLVDDFVATRMDSVHGCAANRRELLPIALPLTLVSSSASYTPTRRLPSTEEFNQVIAPTPACTAPPCVPTPVRVAPPLALAPSTRRSPSRLEPISEEEVESPASLRLTLGRAMEIVNISG